MELKDIKEKGVYIINPVFFEKYPDKFYSNKNNRPHCLFFKDKKFKEIYWVIPISTKYTENKEKTLKKYSNLKDCPYLVFNHTRKEVLNLNNAFPILSKYVLREFKVDKKHFILKDKALIEELKSKLNNTITYKYRVNVQNSVDIRNIFNLIKKELSIDNNKQKKDEIKTIHNKILKINKEIDNKNEKSANLKSLITKFEKLEDKYYQVKEKKEEFNSQNMFLKLFLKYKLSSLNYDLKSITEQKEKLEKSSGFSLATAKNELLLNEKEISSLASKRNEMLKEKSSLEKEYNQLQVNNQNNSNTNDKKIENVENNTLNLKR